MKERVVIFGATGFVGSTIIKNLDQDKYEIIEVSRKDCDFADISSRAIIENIVQDGDIAICAAAKAPAKDLDMLIENISIISNIVEAIKDKELSYVLNVSSDAIFGDSMEPLNEDSEIVPLSAHGIMHCMREHILEERINAEIGHIRPTLIYGKDDPHNGYGPNSFIRKAIAGEDISLFGNGEEQRDHIFVGDVAKIAISMIENRVGQGVNAVTGKIISFMEIAELVKEAANGTIKIKTNPRSGPMPHNGYRAFSNEEALEICPGLEFKDIAEHINEMIESKNAVQLTKSA
jgi:nucleoside-diphosphate-sugar epimerase